MCSFGTVQCRSYTVYSGMSGQICKTGTVLQIHVIQRSSRTDNLIVLGFNDTSTPVGHFVSSPREREKRDRRDSRGDEREEQGRKRNRNESEETEETKTFPLYLYLLQG